MNKAKARLKVHVDAIDEAIKNAHFMQGILREVLRTKPK